MDSINEVALDMGVVSLSLMTLWLYLPGFLANTFAMMWGKWLPKTGYGPWPIDGGKKWRDGNRVLGDGKTWNGLIGGSLTSGLLCLVIVAIMGDAPNSNNIDSQVFAHPLTGYEDTWFNIGSKEFSAFILGTFLGFACLVGDSTGSFFKPQGDEARRRYLFKSTPFRHLAIRHNGISLGSTVSRRITTFAKRTDSSDANHDYHNSSSTPLF